MKNFLIVAAALIGTVVVAGLAWGVYFALSVGLFCASSILPLANHFAERL